ncbi:cyclophilin-like family protein [Halospeciosus flavus]|uniref:Cyclophilin-like family protein n=1 Tax=Halospeciosus flavus TaxID=3032283 RepID=A0ABD5Z6S4_9EURY|nr:cyclophilin-like family protein [Halospeciosus flavus]
MSDADLTVAVDDHELAADWVEENPETRAAIREALPLAGDATRWGDELYFRTSVDVDPESSRLEVATGALAYWAQGNALCLFWGPTPASDGDAPKAAGPVNVVARVRDVDALDSVDGGAQVRVEET